MYCCTSLSRVGLDFSSMLQPLFATCALRLFSARLTAAVDAFNQRLEGHKWVAMPSPVFNKGSAANNADAAGDLTPPYALMEHVPLAVFTNGVLSALNEVRHCALLPLSKPAATLLQSVLLQVASSLVHYRHARSLADSELPLFHAAARTLADVVVSYLATCFSRVFPGSGLLLNGAAVAGILQEVGA
eukprot:GHRR01022610.1.p1 GENE.GHRR01022610.1~~GHRR01022610.1.p1  ORF type:complete len:188 (+),score=47.84 GHRR01022610.1:1142-1705(+)